MGQIV